MKQSIYTKLEALVERHEEISYLLSDPEVIGEQNRFRQLSQEYSQLEEVVQTFNNYREAEDDFKAAEEMLKDSDSEIREMAQDEYKLTKSNIEKFNLKLQRLLLPKDPNDDKNTYLEIRAGTGGDEAAIFAGDLFRMYSRYAEKNRWQVEVLSENFGDHGGYKEIITRIVGQGVYSKLKFESGAHRVQRVPDTESQGRVHTSACTVVIMAEADEIDAPDINPADLRIDTYRASGAGGQHINKTDSAVRITHLPTGVVIECQDERSQHKNKARALSMLASKLLADIESKQKDEQEATRRDLVGTGDRSDRIRTYNYPQGRMTDHRINLTLYKLGEVMEGELEQIIGPLIHEYQADQLSAMSDSTS